MYWSNYRIGTWDPFAEFTTLERTMGRFFDGLTQDNQASFPALNVWSNEEGAVVTAELPGVDPADVDIGVDKNVLTVEGERKAEAAKDDEVRLRSERDAGRFVRSVRLPFEVERDKVTAACKHGVLTITLPRSEATKPKRIQIAAA